MEKEKHTKKELNDIGATLMLLGPVGFLYFLYMHITKSPLLEEMEQVDGQKGSRIGHGAVATTWTIICLLFLASLCGAFGTNQPTSYPALPHDTAPDYDIISIEDTSIGKTVRIVARVNYKAYSSRPGFQELVAKEVVEKITAKQKVNAIAVFFYSGPTAEHPYLGKVVWAPHGDWSEASNAVTGNYFWHKYSSD